MKIGILNADTVLDQFASAFGQYPDMIEKVMSLAIVDAQHDPIVFVTYDIELSLIHI